MTEVTNDKPSGPAESAAPALGMAEQQHLRRAQGKTNSLLWGIFVLLLILVGGVIFILPNYVAPPNPEVDTVAINAAAAAAAAPPETPFEEAQRMRQREEAQSTLQALLALQDTLEDKQVQQWATEAFDAAIADARAGDEAYARQDFTGANDLYKSGLTKLQDIEAGQAGIYTSLMEKAAAAYAAGDAGTAEQSFSQALLLQPDSIDAATGMDRARVLTQVLDFLEKGRELQEDNELEAAREAYQQALALDSSHADSNAALAAVNTAIVDRNFANAMSRGYAALQGNRADEAEEAFKQALAIKPGASAEVNAALQQAADQETSAAISAHLERARQSEADENWADAMAAWDQALAVDPNLVSAQESRRNSENRNNLDVYLKSIIADPLRLADAGVQAQARQVITDTAALPGAKLQEQLQQVRGFLERINVPATVQLQSDGMTAVTIYRVGDLGMFTTHTLSLTPGAYTAVGVRPGYRDVRQEFTVAIDGQVPVVTVSCTEAI
jgi:tetratricopeptide (TPR) repeat protein